MSYQADEEEKPFLLDSSPSDPEREIQANRIDRKQRSIHLSPRLIAGGIIAFITLQIILIAIYTSVYLSFTRHTQSTSGTVHIQPGTSPRDITGLDVRWQLKKFTKNQDSLFIGHPNTTTEAAWDQLLENMTIRVTKEELQRAEKSSVELPRGGFMAWLGVHHELHCIKYLRQWTYREHFFPESTEQEYQHREVHADHCIEMLRSAAMCRADASLTTFRWETQAKPMLDLKRMDHTCVDWEAFTDSVSHRVVSLEESLMLTNPNIKTTS